MENIINAGYNKVSTETNKAKRSHNYASLASHAVLWEQLEKDVTSSDLLPVNTHFPYGSNALKMHEFKLLIVLVFIISILVLMGCK